MQRNRVKTDTPNTLIHAYTLSCHYNKNGGLKYLFAVHKTLKIVCSYSSNVLINLIHHSNTNNIVKDLYTVIGHLIWTITQRNNVFLT